MNRTTLICSLLLAGATTACSSNVGDAIRPKEGTASEALGESGVGACEADYAKPLIIDISPEDRGDLEAKLKSGGPVVHFDCKSMKILPTCRMKHVKYNWVGYTPKAQLVEMESGDDLGAALPINGMSFKAALERAGRLNLATMTVGQRSAGMLAVDPGNLEGDCAKGTHVINSVWVGAFKLETGSKGEVMAAADVFGAEAHAGSKSERKAMNKDGDVSACEKAKEDADAPPSGCTAFVRLELLKIPPKGSGPTVLAKDRDDGDGENGASGAAPKQEDKPVSCPPGRVWNGVYCAAASASAPTCTSKNIPLCKSRCDKKDGPACYQVAVDASFAKNEPDAKKYYELACNYGHERGCYSRASKAMMEKDDKSALLWLTKGCTAGDGLSCYNLGAKYRSGAGGVPKDLAKAFSYFKRACDAGDAPACTVVASLYLRGEGTPKDAQKGLSMLQKECEAGKPGSCGNLAREYESGANVPKDEGAAEKWFAKGCTTKNGEYQCVSLGDFLSKKGDTTSAVAAYEKACGDMTTSGCVPLGNMHDKKGDKAKAQAAYEKACDKKNSMGCQALGDLLDKKGDKANAKGAYEKACDLKNSVACKKIGKPAPSGPGGPPPAPPPPPPPPKK